MFWRNLCAKREAISDFWSKYQAHNPGLGHFLRKKVDLFNVLS